MNHSSTPKLWREKVSTTTYAPEDTQFPQDSFSRGHRHMGTKVSVTCSESQSRQRKCKKFFETYQACVLTLRNALEWLALRKLLDLSLKELTESIFGDIFPLQAFLA